MIPSIQPHGGDSSSEDQPISSQPTPSQSGDLASVSNNRIHEREQMRPMANQIWRKLFPCLSVEGPMANQIWRKLFPCLSVEEKNIFRDAGGKDYGSIINDISQHLDLIRKGEPTTGHDRQWPDDLSDLLSFLSTGRHENTSGAGFNDFSGAMDVVEKLLSAIGYTSFVTAGFLVIAYGLERFQDVSDNKEECLSILEEMNILNKLVKQCTEREKLKEGMEDEIIAATKLIMSGILKCLTQIKSSPFYQWFRASVNERELSNIRKEIDSKHKAIYFKMEISILDAVLEKPRLSREYPKHAVGIEKSLKEVTDLLEWGTENNAVAVILSGFGGMGKTTVADAVFNRVNINNVDGKECKYSHVELFTSIDSTPDIVKLQKKILEDLMGRKNIPEIRKYQDGQQQICITLQKVPAFIYVDNVLEKDKLRQLLPLNFDTAKKVRLLITARDINVRKACRMRTPPKEYRMRGISSADAMILLKKQMPAAANSPLANEIPLNMGEISSSIQFNRIIDKCGGIPLMLHLVAQELSSAKDKQEVSEVTEQLEKLEGEEFGAKLESYFFVYDKLPKECKEAFLDICSFFKGWDWDTVADIVGKTALDRLERRALVAKGTNGVVTLHDVIMEVGLRKAKETRIRFTATSQLLNFTKDDDKVEQLRYLRYKPAKDLNQLIKDNLKMPPNLKYMEIDGKLHCDDLEIFTTRLLRLPNLRILKLINFQGLKELPSVLGDLVKGLRELTLSNCKSFKELPYSISKLRYLRVLKMDQCENLTQLPKDFGSLKSLEILSINYCDSLKVLPDNFGELSSLKVLNLSFCKALEHLPLGLGKITSLVKLDLSHCSNLISIPKIIGDLKSLLSMDISWCKRLEKLPNKFCTLSMTYLKLTRCTALKKLPYRFGELESLRVLKLKSCTSLQELPRSFSKLKYLLHLDLSGCTELRELCINFNELLKLRTLSLDSCKKLERLPENFHCLYSLQHLNLSNCELLEGESMNNVVKTKALKMVYITKSDKLKDKWSEIKSQCQWSLKVDQGKDLTPKEKENEWEKLSSEFDSLLQNRQGESFHLSQLSLNTILLVMFDGHLDFNEDFPWPLIEETRDDIKINFEIIYIGKHFNKLPKRVADRILGRALDNSDTRLLLEKVFFTIKRNGENLWPQKMNKFFVMSTKIMEKREREGRVEEIGDKYLSCWTLLSDCQMEEFLLEKCGRYLWLKQLAAEKQESSIRLLRELFLNGGEDNSLLKESREVGLDELRGKKLLLEIRPADASYDIRLQSLKNMYITEKDRSSLEIISIPIGQQSIKFEDFSRGIPWLVLQNSWTITRAVNYFLIKYCQWEAKDGEISESWYPSRFMKIELNREVTSMPILSMLERWGPQVYPFGDKNIKELKEQEWNQRKRRSTLEFLFKPLMSELDELKEVMHQRKVICLLCDGNHPRTKRGRTKIFAGCIKSAMKDVIDDIHFIYVPHYDEKEKKMLSLPGSISMAYFPMEDSKKSELGLEQEWAAMKHLLGLQQWAAMRFWMRVCDLRKEIEGIDENDEQLLGMKRLLDSLDVRYLSMAVIDEDGEVLATKGREIADIFDHTNKEAKGLTKDEARKLVADMIKGSSKEERKEAALQLESGLS